MEQQWYEIKPTKLELKKFASDLKMGKFFGYPLCCTEYFIKSHIRWRRIANELYKKDKPPLSEMVKNFLKHLFSERKGQSWINIDDSGFIPCPKCSQDIYELGDSIESLIKNRICTVPFICDN